MSQFDHGPTDSLENRGSRVKNLAICLHCKGEMRDAATVSCAVNPIEFPDGQRLPQVPYANEDGRQRCHDCYVAIGGVHHVGCDMEVCPKCGFQLIGCDCLDDDDDE